MKNNKHNILGLVFAGLGLMILYTSLKLNDGLGILAGGVMAIVGWNIK